MEHFYGYGIVDKEGRQVKFSFAPSDSKLLYDHRVKFCDRLNSGMPPHRVVQLFYKDEQS